MTDTIKDMVRVIAFKEGDAWIAHCVEYDICAQGSDLSQLRRRMEVALEVECEMSEKRTGTPFGGIGPAPSIYEAMYDNAEESLNSELDIRIAA